MDKDSIDATIKVLGQISQEVVRGKHREGTIPCPHCKTGTVKWTYRGPRSFSFYCTTPDCIRGMG